MKKIIRKLYKVLKSLLAPVIKVEVKQINYGEILKGKKILITGGTSGIGKALAIKCLKEGAIVTITGRNLEKLKNIAKEINNPNLKIIEWDISNINLVESKLEQVIKEMNGIEVLFNNAGIYLDKNYFEIEEKEYDKVINTNLKSIFFLIQKFTKDLKNSNKIIKIINIVSIRGYQGAWEPYGISKWGLLGLTKGMAKKFREKGIIVNGIAPGITASAINGINTEQNSYNGAPLDKRVALPEEIAEIGVFLASDATNHIVGQVIICDGGETLI